MKAADLKDWINSLAQDIDFSFDGVLGSICPINQSEIHLCYGDVAVTAKSIDEAMMLPFINGQSLNDISDQLDI